MTEKIHITSKQLLRFLIFAASVALVFIVTPKEEQDTYEYEIGKKWNYNTLVATFDFPVEMDPERVKYISDSIRANFMPIYTRNREVSRTAITNLEQSMRNLGLGIYEVEIMKLKNLLNDIYRTGVVRQPAKIPGQIRIKDDETHVTPYAYSSFYTASRASDRIDSLLRSNNINVELADLNLGNIIEPNIVLDSIESDNYLESEIANATKITRVITQGEQIVARNDKITEEIYNAIKSYEKKLNARGETQEKITTYPAAGSLLLIAIIYTILFGYMYVYRPKLYSDLRMVLFLSITVTAFTIFALLLAPMFKYGIYMVPFTMIPIIVMVFIDSRTAFLTYLVTVFISAALTHFMWDFLMLQFVGGSVALVSINELSKRSQLIRSAAVIFLAYAVTYIAIDIMQTGSIEHVDPHMIGALAINAVLISFAYILMFIVEKCFGFISRVTLVELSDINHPLLRELSEECPGTFQHSMAVSNLAAAAASRVGANVQLVRTGALYHDIGKMSNPAFFTENQHGVNPHNALSPLQSAQIIIGHVGEGLRRAEKAKLPARLRDFITEHHGRGTARYFYTTYCNSHPGENVDPAPFTYPGPNPQSLETSILMMADAVEAASRSLQDHSADSISKLVNKIVDTQVEEGLHSESPISFRDITEIKRSFEQSLRTMYHSRISYPKAARPKPGTGNPAEQPAGESDSK